MTKTKNWLITALVLIIVGIAGFTGVMMKLNWNFTALSTTRYETDTTIVDTDYKNISVKTDAASVEFVLSSESKVVCYESENQKHSVEVKDNTLFIELVDERKWYEHIGINFTSPKITVYLPKTEYGTVSVKTTTGSVTLGDFSAEALDLSLSTGKVAVSNVTCKDGIKVKVSTGRTNITDTTCKTLTTSGDTGNVVLKNTVATEKISVTRSTGSVMLDACDANEISIKTDTGNITGTLLTDKVFIADTDTGRVSVPNTTSGGRCELTTDTGNIKITIAQ